MSDITIIAFKFGQLCDVLVDFYRKNMARQPCKQFIGEIQVGAKFNGNIPQNVIENREL